jgi:hypothetical protein
MCAMPTLSAIMQGPGFSKLSTAEYSDCLIMCLARHASMACSRRMAETPKAEWFQLQALECIGLALRAKDPRIKRLYTLEAQRWLHLAEPKTDHVTRDSATAEYRGVERRKTRRHLGPLASVILLEQDSLVGCTVRDFSPAGVGLLVPVAIVLPSEFDLTFNHATQHCIAVWRQPERMGLEFKSPE